MSFRTLSYCSTLLSGALSIQLMATPENLWANIILHPGPAVYCAGRRSACLFLGLGAVAYSLRNLPLDSEFRQGYCLSVAVCFFALAALGVWELVVNKMAPTTILGPVVVEVAFGMAYVYHSGWGRKLEKKEQ